MRFKAYGFGLDTRSGSHVVFVALEVILGFWLLDCRIKGLGFWFDGFPSKVWELLFG